MATAYADLVFAAYDASVTSATTMQEAIEAFLADPTDANLTAAKEAWLTARDDYGPTEAFRFYDGPIDNPDDGPEGQINAWPMDEAYVDYVEGDAAAGLINDTAGVPEITAEAIVAANEEGGETNISTGWHAVEFLLWGQDLSDDGAGARPVTDYTTATNADRRATYLKLVTQQLHRRPDRCPRPVDRRGRQLPSRVRGRPRAGDHQHRPGHRRPQHRRAGRRAHDRGLRDQGPRGRALLLQRQHQRRRGEQHQGHPDGVPRRVPGRERAEPVEPRGSGRPRARRQAPRASSTPRWPTPRPSRSPSRR